MSFLLGMLAGGGLGIGGVMFGYYVVGPFMLGRHR